MQHACHLLSLSLFFCVEKRCRQGGGSGFVGFVGAIDKGEDFCNHHVGIGWDFRLQLQAGEDFHQVAVFMDRDIMFFGQGEDLVGHQPLAFTDDGGGRLFFLVVAQGYGFFYWRFVAGIFFFSHYGGKIRVLVAEAVGRAPVL